jgi:Rrf2 family iron-sulfur cluster assembly transcriptional regulator
MAMVELAGREQGKPITLAELATSQEITVPYLEQIFSKLKQSGIVKSVRGPGGGYVLARPAAEIAISEIVDASEEAIKMTRCDNHVNHGCMGGGTRCATHDLWEGLGKQIHQYLSSISLSDVQQRKLPMKALPENTLFTNH